jgi:uncharacterized DUF497 family protein
VVVEFDINKSEENRNLRGLPFDLVDQFEFDSALIIEDQRQNYGERRWLAIGLLKGRLHVVVFTLRGSAMRVISLRKANEREITRYEKHKAQS